MKKNSCFKLIPVFTLMIAVVLVAAIISIPSSTTYADSDGIEFNNVTYSFVDTEYIDPDDNIKTFIRTYSVGPNDLNAYVSSALYMPKGRYAKMHISYDLVYLMLNDVFDLSFGLDKYDEKLGEDIIFSSEEYYVNGYSFLSHLDGTYFRVATSDDPSEKYHVGDYYNNDNPADAYTLKNYIDNRLSKYVLDDLSTPYSVESSLKFTKYYTIKSAFDTETAEEDKNIKVVLDVDFSPITLNPVEDGDVFTATGEYSYLNELSNETFVSLSYVSFELNQEAIDTDNGGYNVIINDTTSLPEGATLKYIIDDSVVVDTNKNFVLLSSFPEDAYTIQGVLSFVTNDLQQVTLKSNILTIQNHQFDIRTNNLYSTNVKVNENYSYTLSADRGKTQLSSYIDSTYDWTFNYDKNDPSKSTKISGQNPSFTYANEGDKLTLVEFDGYINKHEHVIFKGLFNQYVSDNPIREKPVYDIKFNIEDGATLVVGGDMVEVSAAINEIYGDEAFKLSYYISAGSNADNISTDPTKLQINPTGSGKIVIGCKATSDIVDTVEKTISIHVVNPKTDKIELISDESFHQNGKDLVVKLSIGGITNFANYKPNWKVQIESGESKQDVNFVTDENGNAVVKQADTGYYLFSINDSVLSSEETTFRVAKVDMQKIAKKYLPIIAVVMIIAIIIGAVLKKKVLIGKTVAKQLLKIDGIIDRRINSQDYTKKQFVKDASIIMFRINNAISIAEELDQASFGQHQPIINSLRTTRKIVAATLSKKDSMDIEKIKTVLNNLKNKYVEPTIKLSNDVNDVMEKFNNERIKNIMVVDPDSNKDEKQK